MEIFRALIFLVILLLVGWLLSSERKWINYRLVITGVLLQGVVGLLILKVEAVKLVFDFVSRAFVGLLSFSRVGATFVFGDLALNSASQPNVGHSMGFIFAFQILPTIVFFAALTSALYYFGILQAITRVLAFVLVRTLGLSGAEGLSVAGNIFLGQTEAPLLIKPYISRMSTSELHCLMTGGMATLAGGVLAAYVSFLGGGNAAEQAKFASFLLAASFMNAPAAVVFSKLLKPEDPNHKTDLSLKVESEKIGSNLLDAITRGIADGLKLAVNVGAMVLAFVALIALLNYLFSGGIGRIGHLNQLIAQSTAGVYQSLSLEYILGQLARPIAYMMGVPWADSMQVGSLLGQKTVINEFIAYADLAKMKAAGTLSYKSQVIAAFALCGFSNFTSIAIQVGGIGALEPSQKTTLSQLGFRALLAAALACLTTGIWAGILIF